MTKKAQELALRNIMQGLEEFATFMSYQSNYEGLRILSVETVTADEAKTKQTQTAKVYAFPPPASPSREQATKNNQTIQKQLHIQDRIYH